MRLIRTYRFRYICHPIKISYLMKKKCIAIYGKTIKSILSEPIYPNNFSTFNLFIDKVADEWMYCYKMTHS